MSSSSLTENLVLRLSGITRRFGPVVANEGVDLELRRGEVLALLGENGAGKTTLMNILFGHYVADSGMIEVARPDGGLTPLSPGNPRAALAAGIGMVHQHFTLADNLTVLDNILVGAESLWRLRSDRGGARDRLTALIDRSGLSVDLDSPVSRLSVGERQRVEILKALYRDARILILDEPTAVLTPQETEGLFAVLRRLVADGLSVVFISHKLAEVMAISDRVTVLRGGRVVLNVDTAETDRARLAEAMVGRPVPPSIRTEREAGPPVLSIRNAAVGDRLHIDELTIHGGEIVGIAGVSGNGQRALSDLLAGLERPTAGEIALFDRPVRRETPAGMVAHGVGRVPEDRHREGVVGEMTLWENLILEDYRSKDSQRAGFLRRGAARDRAARVIEDYDVRCPGPDAEIRLLSGGNMQKLILGRALGRAPGFVLANQPTRGLDIGAVTEVHRRLLQARGDGAGILLISEDLDELLALSDRLSVIYQGRLTRTMKTEDVTIRDLGLMMAGQGADAA
ncbi:ABC transporter ATP-binding protein [Inquilinus sp. CAU 1745]|uniref:ABC transporter ATP-binding protein n=1 Tax=Inquilinus sp. CAU 1745 TaxID=3140369 RepID=UPI00325A673D